MSDPAAPPPEPVLPDADVLAVACEIWRILDMGWPWDRMSAPEQRRCLDAARAVLTWDRRRIAAMIEVDEKWYEDENNCDRETGMVGAFVLRHLAARVLGRQGE